MRNGTILTSLVALATVGTLGCGEPRWEPSAEQAKLMNGQYWAYDREATEKVRNEMVKQNTGITANIELKGDVGAVASFLTDTKLLFSQDKKTGKPAWQRVSGSGFMASKSAGWMEWQGDKKFVLKEFDTKDGKKIDVTFQIQELGDKRVVLQKEGETFPEVYTMS